MKNHTLILEKVGEIAGRVLIFLVFIFLTSLLFWKGLDPFLEGMDSGIPFGTLFAEYGIKSIINIAGALLCICYAVMTVFPVDLLFPQNKKTKDIPMPITDSPSINIAEQTIIPEIPQQQIIINQASPISIPTQRNGIGVAGFVCTIVGIFVSWVPVLGWIMWAVGLILSFVGLFKAPRGLAIAGFVLSLLDLILLLVVASIIAATIASVMAV